MDDNSYKVIDVDINEILPNRFQPRIQFDEEEILELSDSIKEHGVIQPLVVRTIGDKYEIIAGERRYKASVLAGKDTVPVIIKNLNDKDSAEIALIENIQRKNLTPIEEAISYKKILDMGYLTQETLANKLGKSQSSVANKIRLLNLSDEVQEALLDNKISERHARSLLRLKSLTDQNKMLDRILNERLTVRKTDEEINKILNNEIKEEKGEFNMNNEINQMTNSQPQSTTTFDIFGGVQPTNSTISTPTMDIPSVPAVEVPTSVAPAMPTFGVMDFNTNTNVEPVTINTPIMETPSVPAVEVPTPVAPAMPTFGVMDFNTNTNVEPVTISTPIMETPSVPAVEVPTPVAPAMPTFGGMDFNTNTNVEPVTINTPIMDTPSVPAAESPSISGGFQFDANGNVISTPVSSPVMEVPSMTTTETPFISNEVPTTAPIIDNTSFNNDLTSIPELSTTNSSDVNNIVPEPIIVTDYSKQYDPIMPEQIMSTPEKVDFKEIINAIRECSQKIEKFGYKIDVEEYDLSTLYQVVFKVEK